MGNLVGPYSVTKRFQVNFSQDPPMHRLELFITGPYTTYTIDVCLYMECCVIVIFNTCNVIKFNSY